MASTFSLSFLPLRSPSLFPKNWDRVDSLPTLCEIMDPVDGDQVYAAERLLQQRTRRGKTEYFVKWKGWSAKHNTWEPIDNILDERLIQEFEDHQPEKAAPKRKAGVPAKEPAAVPQKRGRRGRNAKADSTSDNTSPSTSVGTRRSSRSVASVSEQQKATEQQQQIEDSEASEKPSQETSEESDTAIDYEDGDSEAEQLKKKKAMASKVAAKPQSEKKPVAGGSTNKEKKGQCDEVALQEKKEPSKEQKMQCESFTEDSSMSDNAVESAEEPSNDQVPEDDPTKQPLEIYVERTEKSVEELTATSQNGGTDATSNKDAYVITNEADPNCTHKIQVFSVPSTSVKEQSQQKPDEAEKKTDEAEEDEGEERFEIVKNNTFAGNNGSGNGSNFLETVGQQSPSSNNDASTNNACEAQSTPSLSD